MAGARRRGRWAGRSASWRFAEGIEQLPVVALYVRDALALPVPTCGVIPPRLDGELPERSTLLDKARRAEAAASWAGWWQAVVAQDVEAHQGECAGLDERSSMARLAAEHQEVFDPPAFAGMHDRPALREALLATFQEALEWADTWRMFLLEPPTGRPGQFDYDVIRAVAEQAARRHTVEPGQVRACRGRARRGPVVAPVRARGGHVLGARRPRPGARPHHPHRCIRLGTVPVTSRCLHPSGVDH